MKRPIHPAMHLPSQGGRATCHVSPVTPPCRFPNAHNTHFHATTCSHNNGRFTSYFQCDPLVLACPRASFFLCLRYSRCRRRARDFCSLQMFPFPSIALETMQLVVSRPLPLGRVKVVFCSASHPHEPSSFPFCGLQLLRSARQP